jgi:hypothetical protein
MVAPPHHRWSCKPATATAQERTVQHGAETLDGDSGLVQFPNFFLFFNNVALLFLFDKYYPIMD